MNIKLTAAQKIIACAFIFVLLGALSACGTSAPGLSGAAGVDGLVTETPIVESTPTTVPTPTNTPIPGTYGHIIYVSNRDGQMNLYVTTPDGIEQIRLTTASSEDNTPRISPDGTRVAFVSTVDGNMDVYVVDVASRAVARITDAPQKDSAPAWSSDGSKLAFESFRDGNFEIYVANADGSNQSRLTNDPSGDHTPLWSPVTNDIAFTSDRFGNSHILLLDLNGGVSSLTTGTAPDFAHSWSPDGNWIAYKTAAGGDLSSICMIGRYGLDQRCLTTPSEYSAPVWSPDGRFLAANAKQTSGYGIDVINVADNSVTHLFSSEVDPRGAAPSWSPEGLRLAFQAQALDGNMEIFTVLTLTNEFTRLTTTAAYDGEPIWSAR